MSTKEETEELKKQTEEQKKKNELQEIENLSIDRKIKNMKIELSTMEELGFVRDANLRREEIALEELNKISEERKNIEKKINALNEKIKGVKEGQVALTLEESKQLSELEKQYESIDEKNGDIEEKIKQQKKKINELKENTSDYDNILGGVATKIGLGNSQLLKTVQHYTDIGKKLLKVDGEMDKFVNSAKQMFSLQNVAASLIESYIGLALQIDNAGAKIAATTGAGTKFRDLLTDLKTEGYETGRSIENISQALTAFNDNLIGMTDMSYESVKQLGAIGADFQRLGVSGQEFTQTLNIMTKSMGVSNKQAAELTKELAMIGTNIGLSSQRMIKDFSAASSVLAAQGTKSIKIFKNLAAAARNSGVEMSELLGIAQKFDTFADAAETTAKLNAVLGSQMSATRMLMMDEDKRIEQIIKSVQASGQQFSQMDRFTQKAIANAAGISDMAKANQIFGMSLGAYRRSQIEVNKQADIQKKFSDAVKATIPLQEAFANAIQSIASSPGFLKFMNQAIDFMKGFANIIIKVTTFADGLLGKLILVGGAIKLLIAIVPGLGGAIAFLGKALGAASLGADKAAVSSKISSKAIASSIIEISSAATLGTKGLFALSLAAIAIGGAIYFAALGVAEIVKSFQGLGDAAPYAAAGILAFGVAMTLMIAALASVGPLSGPAIGVLLLIVGTIVLLSDAINRVVTGLTSMFEQLSMFSAAMLEGAFDNVKLLAEGIKDASAALDGLGSQKKIELMTTLNSMATIASGGKYIAGQAAGASSSYSFSNLFDPNINVNNSFGNLKLVLADGTQLDAYIDSRIDN